ncbi:Crp/Fnr family transcriptional regulator [Mucilaginibacter sp. KACC 22063]|uniref:Crp/Fnr family transcriptional regulator n=1 Tax=Mucilaginibacter sp. KACC 22063 TaxID=3025666 RepID=UPI002365E975|nr:Crp/Fnr family transcriptional regulator [Mucilaginibacter sp. KACC 22063]WDF56814.1 Crp/Fnr family transcriptional regulator [Mucilaginibacter sp. KACC 22063]
MDTLKATASFRNHISQFVEYTDEEWALFCSYLEFGQLKKKDHFTENGKVCNHIAFISKGSLRYYHMMDGEDITGYFSFENEFASSYKSFLTRQPAVNYVQALEDTELVLISHHNWQTMLGHPVLAYKTERFGRLFAEYYLICYEERVTAFITQSPEERYLKLLETGREILQRIPQHYVANFLGITPVSLSRIRKRILQS